MSQTSPAAALFQQMPEEARNNMVTFLGAIGGATLFHFPNSALVLLDILLDRIAGTSLTERASTAKKLDLSEAARLLQEWLSLTPEEASLLSKARDADSNGLPPRVFGASASA